MGVALRSSRRTARRWEPASPRPLTLAVRALSGQPDRSRPLTPAVRAGRPGPLALSSIMRKSGLTAWLPTRRGLEHIE